MRPSILALLTLILVNLSLLLGYTLRMQDTAFYNPHIFGKNTRTSSRYGLLKVKEEREAPLLQVQDSRKDDKEKTLIAEMKQCSMAMGMTADELRMNMPDLTVVASKVQRFLDVFHLVIPSKYLQDTKNPCWHSNLTVGSGLRTALLHGSFAPKRLFKFVTGLLHMSASSSNLYCLPYFFIAGFPKSGTTTLHEALQRHPEISRPSSKEPHWWTRVPLKDMSTDYLEFTVTAYLLYFYRVAKQLTNQPSKAMITYDGSQSTLWDSSFNEDYCAMPAAVSKILPNAKFIVLMRNPVTRDYSDFFYSCGSNPNTWPKHVQRDPPAFFHKAIKTDTTQFSRCLKRTNNLLHKCIRWTRSRKGGCGSGHIGKRLPISLYYFHLHKWMQFFPRESFLFLRTEDMCRESHRTMTRITSFLGIEPVSKEKAKEWLCHKANSRDIYSSVDSEKYEMREETKQMLERFYRPFNVKLAQLTGNKRFLWSDRYQ